MQRVVRPCVEGARGMSERRDGSWTGLARSMQVPLARHAKEIGAGICDLVSVHPAADSSDAHLVPVEGIEPTLCCQNRILSPTRLPVPPHRRGGGIIGAVGAL